MLYLGFRNIVNPPNKGWTWSNPIADILPKCKENGCYHCIAGYTNCHDFLNLHIVRLSCVANVAHEFEARALSMQKDFLNHQNKWKRYIRTYFCFTMIELNQFKSHKCYYIIIIILT